MARDSRCVGSIWVLCRPSFGLRVQGLNDRLRIPRGDAKQRQGRSVRGSPSLLPIPERRDTHANHEGEFRLGRAECGSNGLDIGWVKTGGPGRTARATPNLARLSHTRE